MDTESSVTAVEKYFFSPIYYPRSAWSVIGWWESRRPVYNLSVGAAGLVSIAALVFFGALPPALHDPGPPAVFVLAYGLVANLCYTFGAPVDLLLRRILGDRAPAVSQAMFRYGFAFSIGLTLLPVPMAVMSWILRSIFG